MIGLWIRFPFLADLDPAVFLNADPNPAFKKLEKNLMKYFLELKKPNKKLLKSKNFNQITRTTGTNFLAFPCIFQLFLNSIFTSWLGIRIQEGTRMRNRIHSPDNIPYIQITPTSYCQKRLNELSKFTRVFFLHDSHEISYATYLWENFLKK